MEEPTADADKDKQSDEEKGRIDAMAKAAAAAPTAQKMKFFPSADEVATGNMPDHLLDKHDGADSMTIARFVKGRDAPKPPAPPALGKTSEE